jgi:hypothetical protein
VQKLLAKWIAGLLLVVIAPVHGWSAETNAASRPPLRWDARAQTFDANITEWTLLQTLGRLSRITGWHVFLEPGTDSKVSTGFQRLPVREALPRMLGELNFALMTHTNGVSQLFIYRSSLDSATQRIEARYGGDSETAPGKIRNELLVALKSGGTNDIEALARRLNAKIIGSLDDLEAYRLRFGDEAATDAARDALANLSDVGSVENNVRFPFPESAEAIALGSVPALNLNPKVVGDKDRVIVGLIDTIVQPLGREYEGFILEPIKIAEGDSPNEGILHGTSMAETILRGVSVTDPPSGASPVRILPVDIYGSSETTSTFEIVQGISQAVANGATILNLSLGGPDDSALLRSLIQNVSRNGALVVAAAGNQPVGAPTYPAAYAEALAVTAGNARGDVASYANFGPFVDVMAPGTSVLQFNGRTWVVSGTSPATAYVSGIAGGLMSQAGTTSGQARQIIESKLPFFGKQP